MLNDMGDTPLHRAAFTGRKVKHVGFFKLQLQNLGNTSNKITLERFFYTV